MVIYEDTTGLPLREGENLRKGRSSKAHARNAAVRSNTREAVRSVIPADSANALDP